MFRHATATAWSLAFAIGALSATTALPQDAASPIEVQVDGQTLSAPPADTLRESLDDAGVVLGPLDQASEPLGHPGYPGARVEIVRGEVRYETVEDVVEHGSVQTEDPSLERGKRQVRTEGVDGLVRRTFEVTTLGGEETSRVLMARVELMPVHEEVAVGTKDPEPEPPAPAAAAPSSSTTPASRPVTAPAGNHTAASNQQLAAGMVSAKGWGEDQFQCLVTLWNRESNWNHLAKNPSSGAYGIPQSLPGSKMASHGGDWQTNPATQIAWGLDYIAGRYATPCGALDHSYARGWY